MTTRGQSQLQRMARRAKREAKAALAGAPIVETLESLVGDPAALTILDVMDHPQLFRRMFAAPSWFAWRVFLAALFGLPMDEEQAALFRSLTGRETLPTGPSRETWVVVGRRGGKSRIAALIAVYLACFRDHRHHLADGERGTVMLLAADRRQARTLLRYISGMLDAVPALAGMVEGQRKAESIELSNGVSIEVHTASYKSVRGYTTLAAICDEVAFWNASEDAANPDDEVLNALRPSMATILDSMLVSISSPYARRGVLWTAYEGHWAKDGDPVLVWQADTRSMNPAVDESVIARAYTEDEIAASAEYGAQFRRDVEAFLPREAVEAVTIPDRSALPPMRGKRYVAFTDPSGGTSDSFTLAIAHAEGTTGVLDAVHEVRAPFSPDAVVQEFVAVLARYGIREVRGDFYAGEWPGERFRAYGVTYRRSEANKSEIYRALLPLVMAQRVELLDLPRLTAQLVGLERRTARGGRDSIDHAPGRHDDLANAVAGVLTQVIGREQPTVRSFSIRP